MRWKTWFLGVAALTQLTLGAVSANPDLDLLARFQTVNRSAAQKFEIEAREAIKAAKEIADTAPAQAAAMLRARLNRVSEFVGLTRQERTALESDLKSLAEEIAEQRLLALPHVGADPVASYGRRKIEPPKGQSSPGGLPARLVFSNGVALDGVAHEIQRDQVLCTIKEKHLDYPGRYCVGVYLDQGHYVFEESLGCFVWLPKQAGEKSNGDKVLEVPDRNARDRAFKDAVNKLFPFLSDLEIRDCRTIVMRFADKKRWRDVPEERTHEQVRLELRARVSGLSSERLVELAHLMMQEIKREAGDRPL